MQKLIKKYQWDLLSLLLLIVVYFVTRLINLTHLPIFTDEAIYIRWSQIGSLDAAWRYIPLTDGKPPLYHWIMMLTLKVFADPLFAGRVVSVFAGFLNLIGIWLLTYVFFKKISHAHLSALIYVFSPFMMVYDRLAVVDSLLTSTSIYCLFFAVLLVKHRRLDTALLLGISVGAGMLTKASGLIFLLMTPLTGLLLDLKSKKIIKTIFIWVGFLALAAVLAEAIYSILRLSQFFYRIEQKNYEFIIPLSEFLKQPFAMTWGNAKSLFKWQLGYLTLPIASLIIFAFFDKKNLKEKLILLGYVVAPFIMIASFNKIIFPRFLLFSTPFLLILASYGLDYLTSLTKLKPQKFILILFFLSVAAYTSVVYAVNPKKADIVQADRDQYVDSWPAGWGINETVDYLKKESADKPIYVGTQGTFGLMPYSLEIYLYDNKNVEIQSFWPVTTIPTAVLEAAETKTTYFIYNELEEIPPQDNIELVLEFEKGRPGQEIRHMRLFRVHPITK